MPWAQCKKRRAKKRLFESAFHRQRGCCQRGSQLCESLADNRLLLSASSGGVLRAMLYANDRDGLPVIGGYLCWIWKASRKSLSGVWPGPFSPCPSLLLHEKVWAIHPSNVSAQRKMYKPAWYCLETWRWRWHRTLVCGCLGHLLEKAWCTHKHCFPSLGVLGGHKKALDALSHLTRAAEQDANLMWLSRYSGRWHWNKRCRWNWPVRTARSKTWSQRWPGTAGSFWVSSVGKPESRLGGEKLSVSRLSNLSPTHHQHQARPVWSRHLEFFLKARS